MAVLAPVLERKLNTEANATTEARSNATMSADECHNSRIRSNYEKLINPDATANDILNREPVVQRQAEVPVAPIRDQKPQLVEHARSDSDLFRADSAINRRHETASVQPEEEESEDLRPTPTTIQYKSDSVDVDKVIADDKISIRKSKLVKLSKRDIIIIAVTALIVVALFVLVIVNSAVLSNLNKDVDYLKSDLVTAQESYAEAVQAKDAYLEDENLTQIVDDFANSKGMQKVVK